MVKYFIVQHLFIYNIKTVSCFYITHFWNLALSETTSYHCVARFGFPCDSNVRNYANCVHYMNPRSWNIHRNFLLTPYPFITWEESFQTFILSQVPSCLHRLSCFIVSLCVIYLHFVRISSHILVVALNVMSPKKWKKTWHNINHKKKSLCPYWCVYAINSALQWFDLRPRLSHMTLKYSDWINVFLRKDKTLKIHTLFLQSIFNWDGIDSLWAVNMNSVVVK